MLGSCRFPICWIDLPQNLDRTQTSGSELVTRSVKPDVSQGETDFISRQELRRGLGFLVHVFLE